VRVNPSGNAVIAGRAAPQAEVVVRDGDTTLGTVTADARGEWVLVPEKALPPGNRSLSLTATLPGKTESVASNGDVLIAVPEPQRDLAGRSTDGAAAALALLVPRAGGEMATPLQVPESGKADIAKPGPAKTDPAKTQLAMADLTKSADAGKGADAALRGRGLSLDIVQYDTAGGIALAGRAEPGARLSLYLGDRLIGEARSGSDGKWSARPTEDVAPGTYQLRVDQQGSGGQVVARVAVPFERAAPGAELAQGQSFTVQPGNSLWRIARRSYGSGLRYVVIYAANRDQISNPDLIYPGQIVKLPQTN
jgi:nucleoid-associated protein YgaU